MIDSVIELRKYNSYQLALMLREHGCDPDIAVYAAWWVIHKKPPRSWPKHMQTALGKIVKYRMASKKFPKLNDNIFNLIMKVYKTNITSNKKISLI